MTNSSEPNPERTDLSTQELPKIPTVQEMKTWDTEKVLRWIQQRNHIILKDDLEKFNEAYIIGRAFLAADVDFYHETCDLPLGVAVVLKDLADEVKGESKLSNQTAGRKRKEDETDASEPSISPKKIRQEGPLWESATRAREQRELIRKFITDLNSSSNQHSKSVYPLPGAVDKLSDPTFECKLTFPFIGMVPERFKIDNKAKQQKWLYMGRIMFRKLVEDLKMVRKGCHYSTVWLYGTQGYGKSHLLAVLVCYLAAQDERVVYIPDCGEWLRDRVGYIKKAMLFAWADDITTQEEIETLITEAEIEAFFDRQMNVLVICDQLNALTEPNGPSKERKECAKFYRWLVRCAYRHTAVFSSSASYQEFVDKSETQTSNWVVRAYGGLERTEMDQWWKRHKIDMGGYKRSDVEDVTGRIPLLLDKCMVGGKIDLTVNKLREIYNEASSFVQEIRDKTTGQHSLYWEWYLDYVTACFRHSCLPSGLHFDLIDHRYFYALNDGSGRCVCGLVRDAVAEQLLQWGDKFIDAHSLNWLTNHINNPSAVGFMIKHAILSSIRSNGLAIDAGIRRPMKVRLLTKPSDIKTDIRDEPVLYWPKRFNFETIDGIIVLINPEELNDEKNEKKIAQKITKKTRQGTRTKKTRQGTRTKNTKVERDKLLMFPLQITLSRPNHSDSHKKFFKDYDKWTKHLSKFNVETQFIWITPSDRGFQTHPFISNRPAHGERYIPFEEVSTAVWWQYQYAKRVADEAQVGLTGRSTPSSNITADEGSSEEEEVTAAVSSAGRVFDLRSRRVARQT